MTTISPNALLTQLKWRHATAAKVRFPKAKVLVEV